MLQIQNNIVLFLTLFFGGYGLGTILLPKELKKVALFIYPWIGVSLVCYIGFIINYTYIYTLDPKNYLHIYFFISGYFILHSLLLHKISFYFSFRNLWLFLLFLLGSAISIISPIAVYLPTIAEKTKYFIYYSRPDQNLEPMSEAFSIGAPVLVDFFKLLFDQKTIIFLNSLLPSAFLLLCFLLFYSYFFRSKSKYIGLSTSLFFIYFLLLKWIFMFFRTQIYIEHILSAGLILSIVTILYTEMHKKPVVMNLTPAELLIAFLMSSLSIVQPSAFLLWCLLSIIVSLIILLWQKKTKLLLTVLKTIILAILINPTATSLALRFFKF